MIVRKDISWQCIQANDILANIKANIKGKYNVQAMALK
jgi:hypothetical protein